MLTPEHSYSSLPPCHALLGTHRVDDVPRKTHQQLPESGVFFLLASSMRHQSHGSWALAVWYRGYKLTLSHFEVRWSLPYCECHAWVCKSVGKLQTYSASCA